MYPRETSFTYLQLYVRSIRPSSPEASSASVELLVAALHLPNSIDAESLLRLENVQALREHPLQTLIRIFSRQNLDEYKKWESDNEATLKVFGM